MRHFITFFFCAFLSLNIPAQASDNVLEREFLHLDSVVAKADSYIARRNAQIEQMKKSAASALTADDLLSIFDHIYNEYAKFNSDSAMHYAYACQDIANTIGSSEAKALSDLRIANIIILRGELYTARDILSSMPPIEQLPPAAHTACAVAHIEFCNRAVLFHNVTNDSIYSNPKKVWERYESFIHEGWLKKYYEQTLLDVDYRLFFEQELARTAKPSIKAAMLESAIAGCLKNSGDMQGYCLHLIRSAANDVACANREAQSIIRIIQSDFIDKSSKRAFNYTLLCTDNARVYKDSGRSLSIVEAHAEITRLYGNEPQQRAWLLTAFIAMLSVGLIVIAALLYVIHKKRRSQQGLIVEVRRINEELEAKNRAGDSMRRQLSESFDKLKQEIDRRDSTFINVYLMITKYVAAMKDFKREVYNLVTAGKYDRARKSLSSNELTDEYLRTFYAQFDRAFLTAHPDFLERFNALLRPDKQIWPPDTDRLTPELRIYALVSMGISDTSRIAEFLQYSPQTIYNYRLRVRHSSCINEKDFAPTVARFYSHN